MSRDKINIRHAENGGEIRISNFLVDGNDQTTKTVYEYHGCFWHKHFCQSNYDTEMWNKTIELEETLKSLGYNVVSITSCQWLKQSESKKWYSFAKEHTVITMNDILKDVKNDNIFGFVECDIHVPPEDIAKFSEFPPIFKNCEITIADIGDTRVFQIDK